MHGVIEYDMQGIRGPLANAFVILINALFFHIKLVGVPDIYPKDYADSLLKEYEDQFDFIIVGAGAAGCSLANRLTENGRWSVLLIEAGDFPSQTSEVPGLFPTLIGTKEDWYYTLEKDERACKAYFLGRCFVSRGKVVGGSSSINDMIYARGLTEDYDDIGYESWSSNITYAVFQRLEKAEVPNDTFNIKYGTEGYIKLTYNNWSSPVKNFLRETYKSVGVTSLTHRHGIGYGDFLSMTCGGDRRNMAKNFLSPIKDRPNLFFSKETEALDVTVGEVIDKRATGVHVCIRGIKLHLKARKEVILTAGPLNNAKLLLLSGLGSRSYLDLKKIPVQVDLPGVGKNIQFHLTVPLYVSYHQPGASICDGDYYSESQLITDAYNYIIHRTGDLSHTSISEFVTFINTQKEIISFPNIAIRHMYFKIDDRNLQAWVEAMNYHPRIRSTLVKHNKDRALILFNVRLVRPLSRGQLFLNDTHHQGNPKVIPNFMSDIRNEDYETLLGGFDFVTNMTDSVKTHLQFLDLDIPFCRNFKFCTPAYVKCYIQNMAVPENHIVGSTLMGADCQQNAVVKENLEVRSVRCLRVADSSVLGTIPIGNTLATDAMIGFKMAEILRDKWEKNYHSDYLPERHNEPV